MYLHLGKETLVDESNIVGLFDLDTATLSAKTRNILAKAEKSGQVVNVSTELPKSFIITAQIQQPQRVYVSQLSTATLKKRSEEGVKSFLVEPTGL